MGGMQARENDIKMMNMKKVIIDNDELVSLMNQSDCEMVVGGTRLSYVLGYLLSVFDNVKGADETRYGGGYLESNGSHSSIM